MTATNPASSAIQVAATAAPGTGFPKQAVVVIHGMGEQMPMDTIKEFVRAVWETDGGITRNGMPHPAEVWSKPDLRTGSLELRRITTRQSIATTTFPVGVRTDFYELYWADLSGGSTVTDVQAWIAGLLLRNPVTRVPRDVLLAWIMLWLLALAVVVLAIATVLPSSASIGSFKPWAYPPLHWLTGVEGWLLAFLTGLLGWAVHHLVVPYFGRVVRYTRAKPGNMAARKDIRERGLTLLNELHKGDYVRIIVVGHSLGSIVAYDLVSYFWGTRPESHTVAPGTPEFVALQALEKATADLARDPASPVFAAAFRDAQRAFGRLLRLRPRPAAGAPDTRWLITDLVTLGSPLTHAEFLMAKTEDDLAGRKKGREFPTSPPVREDLDPDVQSKAKVAGLPVDPAHPQLLSFPLETKEWQLHHAAPYAAVRWSNIHDPSRFVFCGDIVSGPVAPNFGPGVIDIDLRGLRGQSWTLTHTKYWSVRPGTAPPRQVIELRRVLDLAAQHGVL